MKIKIKGFEISVTFTAIALLAVILISDFSTGFVLSFLAILIHEAGHITAMFLCKNYPDALEISAFDIRIIKKQRYEQVFYKDIIITAFGVIFNFLSFAIFLPLFKNYAYVNLFIGVFNLLPTSTLDGGQLLYLFFSRKLSQEISSKIVDMATILTAFPLFVLGILVLFNSKYNFSLLFISIYLILSLFIKNDKIL